MLKQRDIRVKINTVVTDVKLGRGFHRVHHQGTHPERWKLLQVLPVGGQNDGQVGELTVTLEQFSRYVSRNRRVEELGIYVVAESNDLMTGSYVMVDPAGRFFDNSSGSHTYSRPILEAGIAASLQDVTVDPRKFQLREGMYDWSGSQPPIGK